MPHLPSIVTPSGQTFLYWGRPLEEGPLPAVFYFALSAEESLQTDPFNQMVEKLISYPLRIFSTHLPFHGGSYKAVDALSLWAAAAERGEDVLTPFLRDTAQSITFLKDHGAIIPAKVAVAGLSRGSYIATNIAAELDWLPYVLGFAPLTQLVLTREFSALKDSSIAQHHSIFSLKSKLINKTLRYYISNHDMRVSTASCMAFIEQLSATAHQSGVRSAKVELIVSPPIGYLGHGTSKEIFEEGALWLAKNLEVGL